MEREIDIDSLFQPGSEAALAGYLKILHAAEIAELFPHLDEQQRNIVAAKLTPEQLAEVLTHLESHQIEAIGSALDTERLIEAFEELETDDAADILAELSEAKTQEVLEALPDRGAIERLLRYPDDSAGGIMQTELCRVRADGRVTDAIDAVRRAREELWDVLVVYAVDERDRLRGVISLQDLVVAKPDTKLEGLIEPIEVQVTADVDQEEVAQRFMKYDVAAIPVVDAEGRLLGRITFDDVHDVLEEEASEDIMVMAGASSEDLVYGGDFLRIAGLRMPWLLSSLFGSLITTQIVPRFSHVPGDTLVLAAFVPVVMAMTGNVGSQSAMIVTRGLAIGKVAFDDLPATFRREMSVGVLMGLAAGAVVAGFTSLVYGDPRLGGALMLSMLSSMSLAALIGAAAPAAFKKIGIDPAIAAGPLVTTGCDVLGVAIYLAVALAVLS
jgi:magnesium transporter